MFANIRAKTSWNIDGPLLWGYFFIDGDAKKLQQLGQQLASEGYHVVGIGPTRDQRKFVMRVEKVEPHTPESLNERNQAFYVLAEKYGIESYDGMDVGPAK